VEPGELFEPRGVCGDLVTPLTHLLVDAPQRVTADARGGVDAEE
jgi:hypothetical protein